MPSSSESVASYFKIDVSLVVINNVYYADGGVNVDYYCYFVRAQRGRRGRGDAGRGISGLISHHGPLTRLSNAAEL